ncbi:Sas10/Utp3/C1D family-domain-containing protein [Pseudomassariella vexata]|uniref:Exosome complex protein n=1 Tax=Pseudomassariella vexata TaxID=1141098 RepID=A0A1Y2DMI3_9PEZI|nr:Sas10/Utp3/C1D family-domain-containing protein [Pseudomassariella vexata]ORY60518.1 Sas10/Utp3/C1D family-domain-containing protein [Pseudomassariella vexata]
MDVTNILPRLERLDGEIDNLEEILKPILASVPNVSSKLPLLDKAKLYVLVTYALESMLFSVLRLNGVNAKEYPIFKELTRVRQYFDKIKNIENPPPKPENSLNKEAAIRFIRSDLADNKEVNTKLTEMIAKEKAKSAFMASQAGAKRRADESDSSSDSDEDSAEKTSPPPAKKSKSKELKKGKKPKRENKERKQAKKTMKDSK